MNFWNQYLNDVLQKTSLYQTLLSLGIKYGHINIPQSRYSSETFSVVDQKGNPLVWAKQYFQSESSAEYTTETNQTFAALQLGTEKWTHRKKFRHSGSVFIS